MLADHKASNRRERLAKELKRFNLTLGGLGSGHGFLLDGVYDLVIRNLEAAKTRSTPRSQSVQNWPALSSSQDLLGKSAHPCQQQQKVGRSLIENTSKSSQA
ncbi:hypothetical protein [Bradyrhizobium sp. SSUT77]|uniref:hypothetical protein n=1 Tax=Bradyrhizobium sp. SSUT77 TaxID=3040603 RepID=UPI0024469D00|nr:hypothetical protein [Bradyrhizobium sp. SSUT77]MDH2348126.1 hypothetical protein [Bradyrhizobium sp. SSUT77]